MNTQERSRGLNSLIKHFLRVGFTLSLLSLGGCDDEGTDKKPEVRNGGDEAGEMGGAVAGEVAGAVAGEMGGTVAGDMAGEMPGGGSSLVRTIENCEQLCAVYDTCEAVDLNPWGDCMAGCAEENWEDQGFRSFVSCLRVEACETLNGCRIPPPPLPACADACSLLEECDVEFRLPMSITQMDRCNSACGDETWARQISMCVQSNERRLCEDSSYFDSCILEQRGGECAEICATKASCDDSLDTIDCTLTCLAEAPEADPLAEYQRQQLRRCLSDANGCDALEACLEPPAPALSESVTQICDLAETCELFFEGACPEVAGEVLRELSDEGISCLADRLEADCASDLTDCFASAQPAMQSDCAQYCFEGAICDVLQEGQSEFDCVEECNELATDADPSAFADYAARIACINALSCEDLEACLSGVGSNDSCADLCAQQAGCGFEEEAACLDRCNSHYATERGRQERACGRLLSCENSQQCVIPPAPNCEDYCSPLEACGLTDETCLTRCDNAELANPEAHLPLLTCVNSSARCDRVDGCSADTSAANACLAFCSYQAGCTGGDAPSAPDEACALACARGELDEADAINFATGQSCLAELSATPATCGEVEACFGTIETLCEEVCASALTCGLPLTDDCAVLCGGEGIAESALACEVTARARGEGCLGTATCLNFPVPVPTPSCEVYCDAIKACDPSSDLFLCQAQCIADPAGDVLRAACMDIADCSTIDRCQDESALSPVACLMVCGEIDYVCPDLTGEGARFETATQCADHCGGTALALGDEGGVLVSECLTGAGCEVEGIDACLAGQLISEAEEICNRSLAALEQCGLADFFVSDVAQFMMECQAQYDADPAATEAQVVCLEDTYLTDPTCFSAILNCGFF